MLDLDGVRIDERSPAGEEINIVVVEVSGDLEPVIAHDRVLLREEIPQPRPWLHLKVKAVQLSSPKACQVQRGLANRLERDARACSTLNLRTGIAFCPTWMRRSYASRRALDETGAADRDMPPQGQDPAPGSAAHDFGHCLAASERGQVARHPG